MNMLDSLKKNLTRRNILAYLIFGAIILVFVLFGYQASGPQMMGYAAVVNDKTISIPEFQNSLNQMMQFYSGLMGGKIGDSPEMQAQMRNSALDQLIQREVVSQVAHKEGFIVTDAEIRDILLKAPTFQKDGVFQRSYYEAYLQNQGTTAARFENQLKRDMVVDRVRRVISEGIVPFNSELKKIQVLKSKAYTVDFMKIDEVALKDKVSLEELGGRLKDSKAFEADVQKLGLKWQTAKPVSLDSDTIPEVGASERVMGEVFKLTEKGQVVPELLSTPQGYFAVRLNKIESKAVPANPENLDATKNQIGSQRSNEFLSKWTQNASKNFSIEKNLALIGQ
ncbi:MAG: SurA N-terminal domain-containing protein [Bdellovibrionota bacterium]